MRSVEDCLDDAERLIEQQLTTARDKASKEALHNTAFWIARARISYHAVKQEQPDA